MLALELSRLQSVLEAEARLGGDLLEELLLGTDDERARMRLQILGYDLGLQQRVGVVDYPKSVLRETRRSMPFVGPVKALAPVR